MGKAMKHIAGFLLLLLGFMSSSGDTLAQSQPSPTRELLLKRAEAYYAAFQSGDFERAWGFFDATMKRDNPKDAYVKGLQQAIKKVQLVDGPKVVWVENFLTGEKSQPVGQVEAVLSIWDADGKPSPVAVDSTKWIWESPSQTEVPTWFLIGGPIVERRS